MPPIGKRTLEDAARGDVPERFVQVVSVVVRGDQAIVAQLMNDIPPYEVDTAVCFREADGSWVAGSSGNSTGGYLPTGRGVGTVVTWSEAQEGAHAARFIYRGQEQIAQVELGCVVAVFDQVPQADLPFDGPQLDAWFDTSGVEHLVERHEIPDHFRARFRAFAEGRGPEGWVEQSSRVE